MIHGVHTDRMGPFSGSASATYQSVCGQLVALRPHANDPRNGLVLHTQDMQSVLQTDQLAGLTRQDGQPVANIVDQQTGMVFRDEFEVDLGQNYGVLVNPSPQASPMASPHTSPRAIRKAPPSRSAPLSADQSQTECSVCCQDLGHKAGRYSMNCRCVVKPCHHRLVCNACGVFFADETVKRREQPTRQHPGGHNHTEKFKVHCQACSHERYDRCMAAHMKPSRVGNRKKRSPKVKRLARRKTATTTVASPSKTAYPDSLRDDVADDMMAIEDATHRSAMILDRLAMDSEGDSAAESNPGSPPDSDLYLSHDSSSTQSLFDGLALLSFAAAEIERGPAATTTASG